MSDKKISNKVLKIFLSVVWVFSQGCGDGGEKIWEGSIYPNRDNPAIKIDVGSFKTLDLCRDAAKRKLRAMRLVESGDYECRKNCRTDESGNQACEETVR